MRSLAFLGGALFGAVTVASIYNEEFRDTSKKLIANISKQISQQIDEAKNTEQKQTDTDNKDK